MFRAQDASPERQLIGLRLPVPGNRDTPEHSPRRVHRTQYDPHRIRPVIARRTIRATHVHVLDPGPLGPIPTPRRPRQPIDPDIGIGPAVQRRNPHRPKHSRPPTCTHHPRLGPRRISPRGNRHYNRTRIHHSPADRRGNTTPRSPAPRTPRRRQTHDPNRGHSNNRVPRPHSHHPTSLTRVSFAPPFHGNVPQPGRTPAIRPPPPGRPRRRSQDRGHGRIRPFVPAPPRRSSARLQARSRRRSQPHLWQLRPLTLLMISTSSCSTSSDAQHGEARSPPTGACNYSRISHKPGLTV